MAGRAARQDAEEGTVGVDVAVMTGGVVGSAVGSLVGSAVGSLVGSAGGVVAGSEGAAVSVGDSEGRFVDGDGVGQPEFR